MSLRHRAAADSPTTASTVGRRRRRMRLLRGVTATAAATAGLAGLATPANADILTPNGVQVHSTLECIHLPSTVNVIARPDPEGAVARISVEDIAIGQVVVRTQFVRGVPYPALGETRYAFPLPEITGDGDVRVYVEYGWETNDGQLLFAGEWLPDPCYV